MPEKLGTAVIHDTLWKIKKRSIEEAHILQINGIKCEQLGSHNHVQSGHSYAMFYFLFFYTWHDKWLTMWMDSLECFLFSPCILLPLPAQHPAIPLEQVFYGNTRTTGWYLCNSAVEVSCLLVFSEQVVWKFSLCWELHSIVTPGKKHEYSKIVGWAFFFCSDVVLDMASWGHNCPWLLARIKLNFRFIKSRQFYFFLFFFKK